MGYDGICHIRGVRLISWISIRGLKRINIFQVDSPNFWRVNQSDIFQAKVLPLHYDLQLGDGAR
jgi:hypothetical protein